MNEIARLTRTTHATTQAADGLPRLAWTLAEFERLSELGFFGGIDSERERVELVDGELLPMHAKGGHHEWVRARLQKKIAFALGQDFDVLSEPGWRPGGELYLEPDILVCRSGVQPAQVPAADVLLLIEVCHTSERYDLVKKAAIYARLGVREYWVVNAATLETRVHLEPAEGGYGSTRDCAGDNVLAPHLLNGLTLVLSDIIA